MRIGRYGGILDLIWAKNRGNVGRHPHMIAIAISPLLDVKHEICSDFERRKRVGGRTYAHKSSLPVNQD